jgi:SP family general alpha glucoside:H+ symporter-like MFS transporter
MGLANPLCSSSELCTPNCLLTAQWIWPVPLIIIAFLAPESPWWLVRKGRIPEARRSLERLTARTVDGQTDDFDIDRTIAMMEHTNMLEEKVMSIETNTDTSSYTPAARTSTASEVSTSAAQRSV